MVSEGRNSRFTRTVNPTSRIRGVLLLKSSEIQAIAELYILLIDFFPPRRLVLTSPDNQDYIGA